MAVQLPHLVPTIRRLERLVGAPLETAIGRGQGVDVLLLAAQARRRGINTATWARGAMVHACNLPTRRDVQSLRSAVARLEANLEELGRRLEDEQEARR
jgi:hypothetical protein